MKRTMLLCLALLLALWSAACGETVSLPKSLGVNASQGTVQDHWDDHGGMSDGTEYWEIAFSPEDAAEFEESLQTAQGWHALPLDSLKGFLKFRGLLRGEGNLPVGRTVPMEAPVAVPMVLHCALGRVHSQALRQGDCFPAGGATQGQRRGQAQGKKPFHAHHCIISFDASIHLFQKGRNVPAGGGRKVPY